MNQIEALRNAKFGSRTAEDEREKLRGYFVQTEQWNKVFNGDIDIVYGMKGSGKSAIYSLISESSGELFDRNIIAIEGENPQGAPAFKDIGIDPPEGDREFVDLWKLYIITLCGQHIKEYGIRNKKCDSVVSALEDAELIPSEFSLSKVLKYALDYVKAFRPSSVEAGLGFDQNTGLPNGINGKINFSEPSAKQARAGVVSVDDLFQACNDGLAEAGVTFWILLDRLDVAFSDKADLESLALKALFKCYLDTRNYSNISQKIFLRTDIWNKISEDGFREASHIERSITIEWSDDGLLNLVVRRLVSNKSICEFYNIDPSDVLSSFDKQQAFMDLVFPKQVDTGPNKPTSFRWILSRTKDGLQKSAPREVIHFINELRNVQISRLEKGMSAPTERRLFEQAAFKEALPAVSKVRLEQTIYSEFPDMKQYIEKLRESKATQSLDSLCKLWNCPEGEAFIVIQRLEEIGFFERPAKSAEQYWNIPFLYREALDSIQGSA